MGMGCSAAYLSPGDKAGLCCIMLKDSQPEFVALVLSYTNANLETGRYDKEYATGQYPTIRWTIGYLRLSMCRYRQLSQIVKEKGHHLDDIDIVISPRDDSLRYDYRKISLARWKRYPELVKRVEALKPQSRRLLLTVANDFVGEVGGAFIAVGTVHR
jgi:hypothetical protein